MGIGSIGSSEITNYAAWSNGNANTSNNSDNINKQIQLKNQELDSLKNKFVQKKTDKDKEKSIEQEIANLNQKLMLSRSKENVEKSKQQFGIGQNIDIYL